MWNVCIFWLKQQRFVILTLFSKKTTTKKQLVSYEFHAQEKVKLLYFLHFFGQCDFYCQWGAGKRLILLLSQLEATYSVIRTGLLHQWREDLFSSFIHSLFQFLSFLITNVWHQSLNKSWSWLLKTLTVSEPSLQATVGKDEVII